MEGVWQTSGEESSCQFSLPCSVLYREAVQHAVFVAELASVQMTAMTVEAFCACDKLSLACNLLHTRAESPKVTVNSLYCVGNDTVTVSRH